MRSSSWAYLTLNSTSVRRWHTGVNMKCPKKACERYIHVMAYVYFMKCLKFEQFQFLSLFCSKSHHVSNFWNANRFPWTSRLEEAREPTDQPVHKMVPVHKINLYKTEDTQRSNIKNKMLCTSKWKFLEQRALWLQNMQKFISSKQQSEQRPI